MSQLSYVSSSYIFLSTGSEFKRPSFFFNKYFSWYSKTSHQNNVKFVNYRRQKYLLMLFSDKGKIQLDLGLTLSFKLLVWFCVSPALVLLLLSRNYTRERSTASRSHTCVRTFFTTTKNARSGKCFHDSSITLTPAAKRQTLWPILQLK